MARLFARIYTHIVIHIYVLHICVRSPVEAYRRKNKKREMEKERKRESQWVEAEKVNWFTNI